MAIRTIIVLSIAAAVGLSGCGPDALPEGKEFASVDAPIARLGLAAYREGDSEGVTAAVLELSRVAGDQATIGGSDCSREAMTARSALRDAQILQELSSGVSFQEEIVRFSAFATVLSHTHADHRNCAFDYAIRLEALLPATMSRAMPAPDLFYAEWRADLAARLGTKFQSAVSAAEDRANTQVSNP